jgi:hypothetical protein
VWAVAYYLLMGECVTSNWASPFVIGTLQQLKLLCPQQSHISSNWTIFTPFVFHSLGTLYTPVAYSYRTEVKQSLTEVS